MKNESWFPNSNLPSTTDSATKMKVIYVAVYRHLDIMNELNKKIIFLEVDQAI